jgi:hyperosmotically inducible protein
MMLKRRTRLAAVIAIAFSALACEAQLALAESPARPDDPKFERLDRNRDGYLAWPEVRHVRDYTQAFREADENRDGRLDRGEFVKAEAIHDRIVVGKYVDDALLTTKVKAALLQEPELKSLDVSVESNRGVVLLSGFVDGEAQRAKALKVAVAVPGVKSVKDGMALR